MKRITALLIAVLMLVSVTSVTAFATESYDYGDYSYNLINGKAILYRYNGSDTEITVPGYINGYPVDIGNSLFADKSITKVTVEEGVTVIGESAFAGCQSLTEVLLPRGLKEIKKKAFCLASLKSLQLPESLEIIGESAFEQSYAVITVPKNVKSIGVKAFKTWSDAIYVDGENPYFASMDGALFNKDFTTLLQVPYFIDHQVVLPDSVRTIASYAADSVNRKPILNEGLEVIEDWAIYGYHTGRVFPSTVKKIGMMNFDSKTTEITVLSMDCEIGLPNGANNLVVNCFPGSETEQFCKDNNIALNYLETPGEHQHSFTAQTFDVSCTEDGYTLYTCRCGESYTDSRIPATGHSYSERIIVKPTCTETGNAVYTCTACGDMYEKTLEASGHKYLFSAEVQASFRKNGYESRICTVCGDVAEGRIIPALDSVTLAKSSLTYTGKALKTQSVTVKNINGKAVTPANYTLTFYSRASGKAVSYPKAIGQYKAVVTFRENYCGSRTFYFSVMPKRVSVKKPKKGKKTVTVRWKKSKGVSGYQVTLAANKRFTKGVKTVTVKSGKTAYKFKKLKAGKKYYVRVRSFKKTTVDGRKAKMYSPYSKTKPATAR